MPADTPPSSAAAAEPAAGREMLQARVAELERAVQGLREEMARLRHAVNFLNQRVR
ncbi:MAG: hypothetical protein H0V09_09550 [Gemmatimonadetes bacterium]|nr:hypothetical protein [Gemmatimonadota bacterium]